MLSRIAAGLCLGFLVCGCAGIRPTESPSAVARPSGGSGPTEAELGPLLPVAAFDEDFLMQQRVTVQWADRRESFAAVLQKRGSELLLLGLGPMQQVGFSLTLDDRGVRFTNRSGREMPFQPERILADVQRVFYPWIEDGSACVNCERKGIRAGLEVRERIGADHLEERRFVIAGRPDRGEIVVVYEGWTNGSPVPKRAILSNGWFGYELIIDTIRAERID